MQLEFYTPKPGCFNGTTFFRELGSGEWKPIDQIDENKQRIIFELLRDNRDTKQRINTLRRNGIQSIPEILKHIIPIVWGRLTPVPDINNTHLNFEL